MGREGERGTMWKEEVMKWDYKAEAFVIIIDTEVEYSNSKSKRETLKLLPEVK